MPGPEIVADLRRPEAYPPPVPSVITVIDTHASWVFLTETEAWKVKRPVNFGFLDFSDAEKRRLSCQEEVRLGTRLARDVYLGVAPIHLGDHGHSFVGPGPIVDHAVRMRRLAEEDSALAMLSRDALTPAHLRTLALQLADFYARAPETPALGEAALMRANVSENWEQMRPYFDRFVSGDSVTTLYHWLEGELFGQQARLQERQASGRIREGHGDLRLEHIYFPPNLRGRSLVIDPIDFNRSFRCGDVALDIAFLVMELDAAGRSDLAAYFASQFARAANDYDLYPVLDLFSSYRAWVRAKVACFVASGASTPPARARRKAEEAARLIDRALSYRRPRRKTSAVIVIGGPIGAGKSTVSDALGLSLAVPTISSDAIRKGMAGLRSTDRAPAYLYTTAETHRTYAEMFRRAGCVLDSGRGVILDASFADPALRRLARELALAHDRPFLFVHLGAKEGTLRARLRQRAGTSCDSDAREEHLAAMLQAFAPPDEIPPAERLTLDSERPLSALTAEICARLKVEPTV